MSVMSKIKGQASSKNEWTVDQVKLAIGMKLEGCTRKEISAATGHSTNSVTYVLTRRFADDAALEKFTGLTDAEQYVEYAHQWLTAAAS